MSLSAHIPLFALNFLLVSGINTIDILNDKRQYLNTIYHNLQQKSRKTLINKAFNHNIKERQKRQKPKKSKPAPSTSVIKFMNFY